MPNLLSLKAVVWSKKKQAFCSPSRQEFQWKIGIVWSECHTGQFCPPQTIHPDCACGIYTSPNPEAIAEYAGDPNSIYALMNLYGTADIWTGPLDLPGTYVVRSAGSRVVGLVNTNMLGFVLSPRRQVNITLACDIFQYSLFSWDEAREMIRATWREKADMDPFERSLFNGNQIPD